MLKHALAYLKRGWSVIPLKGPKADKPKSPALETWTKYQSKRASEAQATVWFSSNGHGLGVVTGRISNLVVLDVDSKEGLEDARARYGLNPNSPNVVLTGGGGYHFYFKHPGNRPVPCRVGFRPKMDIRADGGFVAAPGTVHESGKLYTWTGGDPPEYLPSVPPRLLDDIYKADNDYRERQKLDTDIPDGQRDTELTSRVGRIVRHGMGYNDVVALALAMNSTHCKPPLSNRDVMKIVDSIFAREQAKKKQADKESDGGFELKTFDQMVELYGEYDISWLIDGWMPEASCGLFVSPPGMFKTWLLLDLAVSIASGKDFLGQFPVNKSGPVMVVQQEDPYPMLMSRMGQIVGGEYEYHEDGFSVPYTESVPNLYFHTEKALQFSDNKVIDAFTRQIEKKKILQAIIDPLYSAADTDDYMAKAAKQMLFMKKVRDRTGCGFFIAHHTGKTKKGERARDDGWGSQFLNAWLETGWQSSATDEADVSLSRNFKMAGKASTVDLRFNITDDEFSVDTHTSMNNDIDTMLTEIIESDDLSSITDVMKELEKKGVKAAKSTVARKMTAMGAEKVDGSYKVKNGRHR